MFLNKYNSGGRDDRWKILIRDSAGASSSLFSDTYELTKYDSITVDFEYLGNSFENNENWYIEFSSDNGFNYSIISNYIVDVDFTENVCYNETVTIYALDHTFNNQNRIRFRADASGNGDYLYLDDIVISGNANDNLFFEDFEDETQGDTSGTDDVNNINWSSSEGSNTDRLEVRNGNYFEAVDTDAVVSWFTDPITITNYNNLNLSLDLTTANLDDSDYINIKYKLNGGNVQPFLTETNDYNGALTADLSSLSGDTLEIIIEFKSSSNNEYHRIDNVKLTGISACSAPTTYNVTGDDLSICSGSSETTAIGLDGSESGVTYQLLKDGVDEGTAIAGTGNSISFGDFSASGTYTVEATRTDDGCTQTMTGNVIVTVTAIVDASFNTSATSIEVGESITFTDTSTGSPTSWAWDFDGDGSADATTQNPTHTFTTDGTYTVTLTASNSCGSDTAPTTITVAVDSEGLFYEDFDYKCEATTGTEREGTNWYSEISQSLIQIWSCRRRLPCSWRG